MSKAIAVEKSTTAWEPLDEAVWLAWKAKGRDRDTKGRETRMMALKWCSIVALLAVAALWSQFASYHILIRGALAAASVGMTFWAFNERRYALGAAFAGLVVIYNPVVPVFAFSGGWQRALVVASSIPFIASLARRDLKGGLRE